MNISKARKRVLAVTALALLAGCALATRALPLSSAPLVVTVDLVASVFGAGGGHASSHAYSLDATIGQPIIGASSSRTVDLSAGFWQAGFSVYMPVLYR